MTDKTSDRTYVRTSKDEMEAYLYLAAPKEGDEYTRSDLLEILNQNHIVFGIIDSSLDNIINRGIHLREVLVAIGIRQTDGIEGKYEYKFNINPTKKPIIREDGTVDYWSVFAVQTVAEGDVIAIYTPPTMGTPGNTVTGRVIEGKRGKELLPLKGKGFTCAEDNITYVAMEDGKIEYQNNRIEISHLLEIKDNLDFNNGRIDFRGDVVIHGDVEYGSQIHAGGSVTIDGNVESITIVSGRDIILRNGLQGGGKANIKAGGNIFAKFIEGAQVEAKGSVQADVLMNSTVIAGDSIEISGEKATIVGGTSKAISRIYVPTAGNQAEIKTKLVVGIDDEIRDRIGRIKTVFKMIDDTINEINNELSELERIKESGPQFSKVRVKEKTMDLLRKKIKCISDKAEFSKELEDLEEKILKANNAYIAISKYTYPGVTIKTDSASLLIEKKQLGIEYRYEGGEVTLSNIYENIK